MKILWKIILIWLAPIMIVGAFISDDIFGGAIPQIIVFCGILLLIWEAQNLLNFHQNAGS